MLAFNLSWEGLSALIGAALVMAGFSVLLFGDHFDPKKSATKASLVAVFIAWLGFVLIVVPLVLSTARIIWIAVTGP